VIGEEKAVAKFKKVVRVACQGGKDMLKVPRQLQGVKSCAEANKIADGACQYGCLGLGDCVATCKFGAMQINAAGIVEIDEGKCTGCGVCVKQCPRNVLVHVPDREQTVFVKCNAVGKGKDKRMLCKTPCLGCTICEQRCPFDAIHVVNGLAQIDYSKCRACGICVDICPSYLAYRKVIVNVADPAARKTAVIDAAKCVGCTLCKKACPQVNAITGKLKEAHVVHADFCLGCGACVEKCRKEAITLQPVKLLATQNVGEIAAAKE